MDFGYFKNAERNMNYAGKCLTLNRLHDVMLEIYLYVFYVM